MTKFLAAVLSVIAVGVLLIAYGLLSPRAAAFGPAEWQGASGYQPATTIQISSDVTLRNKRENLRSY